ncbi:MAG: hypothetical protein JWR59_984 [Brevundimonas sp.]|nr:hypothetical protein [Brevundimonas sp.]
MTHSVSKVSWVNWVGSAAVVAMIAVVGSAEASQEQQRQGGMVQKGRDGRVEQAAPGPVTGIAGGAVAGIAVARTPEQTACENGTASACRAIEAGLVTGGAWSFVDGGITAMDDWESPVARQAAAPSSTPPAQEARGNHIPQAVLSHRVLAACDGGDVTACRAFAVSVRPSTATERTERRTYTAGW